MAHNGVLASKRKASLVEVLLSHPHGRTTTELAEATGLTTSTVRFHLNALESAALVVREVLEPVGRGRPELRFHARMPAPQNGFAFLAEILTEAVAFPTGTSPAQRAETAGNRWMRNRQDHQWPQAAKPAAGELAHATEALFAELGFAPHLEDDGALPGTPVRVRLAQCPFAELAKSTPQVVCSAHLGILRGFIAEAGEQEDDYFATMVPWESPAGCLATIGPRQASLAIQSGGATPTRKTLH